MDTRNELHGFNQEGARRSSETLVERKQGETAEKSGTIIEEVAAFIRRFVFLRKDVLYELVAAWIISTYLAEHFDFCGYLFAYSPEKQSGKTRLLEVLDCLVMNSSSLLISPTEAVLFRSASTKTLLLDEVDWGNRDALKSVLNAGFQHASVMRMHETQGGYKMEQHAVYGPKALAGIGKSILNVTTRDRTFMLEMVRQTKAERKSDGASAESSRMLMSLEEKFSSGQKKTKSASSSSTMKRTWQFLILTIFRIVQWTSHSH